MGNRINKLEKRLREAQQRHDYATVAKLMQELEREKHAVYDEERLSLYECTKDDEELRHELCVKMIEMTVSLLRSNLNLIRKNVILCF